MRLKHARTEKVPPRLLHVAGVFLSAEPEDELGRTVSLLGDVCDRSLLKVYASTSEVLKCLNDTGSLL